MRYSSDLSRKIMPHAICVILFLNMHTYRFVLPLHADKTLSQGVNNTIRIPALKKEDGENQRNSIILPLQEVRHIRFRRLSPPVKLPIKLSNEKISRARPRIVLAWRNYYFSQDFFRSALSHIDVIQFILQTGRCIFRIQGMNLEDRRDENLGLYAGKRLSATRILQDPQRVGRNLEKSWTQRRETRDLLPPGARWMEI